MPFYIFLCYYAILYIFFLVDLILIQNILWQMAKYFVSKAYRWVRKFGHLWTARRITRVHLLAQKRDLSLSQNWLWGSPSLVPYPPNLCSHHAAQWQTVQHLLLVQSVVSWGPHVSVQCTVINIGFSSSNLKQALEKFSISLQTCITSNIHILWDWRFSHRHCCRRKSPTMWDHVTVQVVHCSLISINTIRSTKLLSL
jgi:hypothetical protein